jgi:VCBS repeat-containing protein
MLDALLDLKVSDADVASPSHDRAPQANDEYFSVPDAHLLFNGEFKRVGTNDLKIVGADGESFFIPGYFASEKRAHLMSPEGATLSPAVVEALAGPLAPGQYAQAAPAQPAGQPIIGRVDALSGSATVVRNGVTVALNVGDNVRRGDVVQTSGDSSVAIVFADGSTFSLNANARMVLDNFVYQAGGAGNTALISLVQGTFSFVAGQVAKTGEMRVETPVATMGIRGTAVLVEISASDGTTRFAVMVEPDGTTGSFNIYNKSTGALIATVNNSQTGWVLTPVGAQQVTATPFTKSATELAQEQAIVQQIFTIFNNNQQNPFIPPQTDQERRGDRPDPNNPQTAQGGGGSGEALTVSVPLVTPGNPTPVNVDVVVTPIANPGAPTFDPTTPFPTAPGPTPTTPSPTGGSNIFDFRSASGPQTIGPDGFEGDNVIYGSQFGDTINAAAGNDTVFAEAGDDTIIGGSGEGNDAYDGGSGHDKISFKSANGVVFHLNLTEVNGVKQSTAQSFLTGSDIFANVEEIVASPGNDVFYVHLDGSWSLDGGAGFDALNFSGRSEGIAVELGVASVNGTPQLQGTASAPQLGTIAFANIESIVGTSGNDTFIVNNLSAWSALNDEVGWELRGGGGQDTLQINGNTGLTYALNVSGGTSVIDIAPGQLRFSGIESIVAGGGNDVFVVRNVNTIAIDAGGGIDIVRFAGGLDILGTDGPNITNFEIVDLGTDALRNVVQFDIGSFASLTGSVPLRILGGGNDLIQISNTGGLDASFVQIGNNVLANGVFGDGLTNGVLFDVYQVTIGGTQHVVYIQDGVAIGAPVGAHDDQYTIHENQSVSLNVLANDTGGSGATLTAINVEQIEGPAGKALGSPAITIVDNQIKIAPGTAFDALAQGETATITITYTIKNAAGETSTATATVTVTGTNDKPVVSGAVTGQATEDGGKVTLNGLARASDVDGDALSLVVVTSNLPAGVTFNEKTNSFTLDPSHEAYQSLAAGETTVVTVDYWVTDTKGGTTPASVKWTVTGTADGSVAVDDTASMTENQVLFVDVLANDGGAGAKTLTDLGEISITNEHGVQLGTPAIVIEDGKIRITPGTAFDALGKGETATIVIPYTMKLADGTLHSATATITVTGTNDAPYFTLSELPPGYQSVGTINTESNFDGVDAVMLTTSGASISEIEELLGLTSGTIDSISQQNVQSGSDIKLNPMEGSAIAFDLALAANETITFSWNFASTEYEPYNDFAFITFGPSSGVKLADIFMIGDESDDGFMHSSGWLTYDFTANAAGVYRLGIGVVDTGDTAYDSALYISGISGIGFLRTTTENGAAETFNLLNGVFDVDKNDVLSVREQDVTVTATDQSGASVDVTDAFVKNGNEITIDPNFFSWLLADESVTIVVKYKVYDGHTTSATNTATLVINGANDAPVIEGIVALEANLLGNGGFEALPDFDGWKVDLSTSLRSATFSEVFIDRSGNIPNFEDDPAVAVLRFSGQVAEAGSAGSGPSIQSDPFFGNKGDTIKFVYQLSSGGSAGSSDRGTVIGRIIDVQTGQVVQQIYNEAELGESTGPQTVNVQLQSSGEFRIEFEVGSVDDTQGFVVGARLDLGFAGILRTGISEDTPFTFSQADFLANAFDANDDDLVLHSVSTSANGATVQINADGSVTYDPTTAAAIQALNAGETIEDTFTFTVRDEHGAVSNTGTAKLTVYGVNDEKVLTEFAALSGPNMALMTSGPEDETLIGGNGNDTLSGNAGNNIVIGGKGDDELSGGDGNDRFYFEPGDGKDVILDFTPGNPQDVEDADVIVLDGFDFDDVSDLTIVNNGKGELRIVLDDDQWIDLVGITAPAQLSNSNFVFSNNQGDLV